MNVVKALFVLIFSLFCFDVVNAQLTIKGKLVDIENEPLSYANITIGSFGSCSSQAGYFEIKLNGLVTDTALKVSCIGFQTKQITLPKQTSNTIDLGLIRLERKVSELDEVVIKAKQIGVKEILTKISSNLSKNYSPKPFSREVYAVVKKYDVTENLIQKVDVVLEEYYLKGYTKNKRKTDDLLQGRVIGNTTIVDDEEFYWIDLFFLRRHDAFSYAHPYSSPKSYNYSIDKTIYEYDGIETIALNYELINPATANEGGWPNAVRIYGKMYLNEIDCAILRIEETIVLKDYDPNEKSEQERKFNAAIKFEKLVNTVNFKKYDNFYYLSDSHIERVYSSAINSVRVVKADLIVTSYKKFNKECNPCNINFSKTVKDPEFWKHHTIFLD